MIKVNETFSFEKDNYGWKLFTTLPNRSKTGHEIKNKSVTTTTYPGTLEHIATHIIEESVHGCESMEQLLAMLEDAKKGIVRELERKMNND